MKKRLWLIILVCLMQTTLFAQMESAYMKIGKLQCKATQSKVEGFDGVENCGTYAGIQVNKLYTSGHNSEEAMVLSRDNKQYNLAVMKQLWRGGFFERVIEWRYKKGKADKPQAMIMRYHYNKPDKNAKMAPVEDLLVTKITKDKICIVGSIPPGKDQNVLAREMADRATNMTCLKDVIGC